MSLSLTQQCDEWDEFLSDAKRFRNLTEFEGKFIDNMIRLASLGRLNRKADLSDKQLSVVIQLEKKIYSVG